MKSIAKSVEGLIESRPFIEEALLRGIINYSALAEELKPEIEGEINKSVATPAIAMAIKRYVSKIANNFKKIEKLNLSDTDITTKDSLFEITAKKSSNDLKTISLIDDSIEFESGDFFTFTNGLFELTLISNKRYASKIKRIFPQTDIIKEIEDLGAITIKLPEEAIGDPGYFYVFTKTLAWKNISIVEIVSTLTELTLIVFENDISMAYNAIKEMVNSQPK